MSSDNCRLMAREAGEEPRSARRTMNDELWRRDLRARKRDEKHDDDGGGGRPSDGDTVIERRTRPETRTKRPPMYKVILLNDDYTPREFVVTVLKAEFRMSEEQAHRVMMTAHRRGTCVVAVFTKDVAEAKATKATDAGRRMGYPLLFTTEPEE